jgi:hypothetical protein
VPGLTVTEKQHWKDRIARRIDKRIEAIAAQDPNLLERVKREARQRALDSLGLAPHQAQIDEIEEQEEALTKRKKQAQRAMLAQLRGVPPEDLNDYYYHHDSEVEAAIAKRQAVHEDELLAENERGRKILQLRQEKDDLLDTVWLATSGIQIKQLWAKVAELLGDDSTQLQCDALAIEPVPDPSS